MINSLFLSCAELSLCRLCWLQCHSVGLCLVCGPDCVWVLTAVAAGERGVLPSSSWRWLQINKWAKMASGPPPLPRPHRCDVISCRQWPSMPDSRTPACRLYLPQITVPIFSFTEDDKGLRFFICLFPW